MRERERQRARERRPASHTRGCTFSGDKCHQTSSCERPCPLSVSACVRVRATSFPLRPFTFQSPCGCFDACSRCTPACISSTAITCTRAQTRTCSASVRACPRSTLAPKLNSETRHTSWMSSSGSRKRHARTRTEATCKVVKFARARVSPMFRLLSLLSFWCACVSVLACARCSD